MASAALPRALRVRAGEDKSGGRRRTLRVQCASRRSSSGTGPSLSEKRLGTRRHQRVCGTRADLLRGCFRVVLSLFCTTSPSIDHQPPGRANCTATCISISDTSLTDARVAARCSGAGAFAFRNRGHSSAYEPRVAGGSSQSRQPKTKTHSRQTGTRPTATATACLALPTPSTSEQLLLELVREIVPGLDDAPFLQLRYGRGVSRREKVPEALIQSPEVWGTIADSLDAEPATTLAFVRQLERSAGGVASTCPKGMMEGSTVPAAGLSVLASTSAHAEVGLPTYPTHTPRPSSSRYQTSPNVRGGGGGGGAGVGTGPGTGPLGSGNGVERRKASAVPPQPVAVVAGKVGVCCGDGHHEHATHSEHAVEEDEFSLAQVEVSTAEESTTTHAHDDCCASMEAADGVGAGDSCAECARGETEGVWGVVVQSRVAPTASGCYILSTCRTGGDGACTCTRFTLQRAQCVVGMSIDDQMNNLWLQ